MEKKLKLLCWSDAATAFTGFGTVSRYILRALHNTGKYEIDHLAVNYHGQFVDKEQFPWQMSPARLLDPRDPYGNKMFIKSLAERDYDLVWILNDTFVVHSVAEEMKKIFEAKKTSGRKVPFVIYYYPVDCRVVPEGADMLKTANLIVAYTEHGVSETLSILPEVAPKLAKIHHGTDTRIFRPLIKETVRELRSKYFGINDDETFLVINVNRNSVRKQLTRTMVAFKEFKKREPNSLLYLHTMPIDKELDLYSAARHIGLKPKKDLVFPPNYSPSHGYPDHILNELYNCADLYLTTHLGEGWGLTVTEAMAAGVPVLAPNNTSMPEILGEGVRGELYPCPELIYVENSGFRPMGLTPDIVDRMVQIRKKGWKYDNQKVALARKWVEQNNWDVVCAQWVKLFSNVEQQMLTPTQENAPMEMIGELL